MSYLGRRRCRPSGIPFSKPAAVCRSTPARDVLRSSGLGDGLPQRILPDGTWLNSNEDFCGMVFSDFFGEMQLCSVWVADNEECCEKQLVFI
jgi:hypothetical protein